MKLNELFPEWAVGKGIFSALQTKGVPWESENISSLLDFEFHGNVSGEKLVSPLLRKLAVNGELSVSSIDNVARLIVSLYGRNWGKLWDTLSFNYDPIENYRMMEQMADDETIINYGHEITTERDNTHGKEGGETFTRDMSQTVKDGVTTENKIIVDSETGLTVDTTENVNKNDKTVIDRETSLTVNVTNAIDGKNAVYGFNSSDPTPTGTQEQDSTEKRTESGTTDETRTETETQDTIGKRTESGTTDETRTETSTHDENRTQTDTGTDKTTYDVTETDLESGSVKEGGRDTHTRSYTLTRSGNIGVTTSQQMIESERNLWFWNFFIDTVFPNVDDVLTLRVY